MKKNTSPEYYVYDEERISGEYFLSVYQKDKILRLLFRV